LLDDSQNVDTACSAPLLPGQCANIWKRLGIRERANGLPLPSSVQRHVHRHYSVSVVGLSMGGAFGGTVASAQREIPALFLICGSNLGMPMWLRIAAATHLLWGKLAGQV